MTTDFAAAVTVSIPIFALAAGTEARSIRDRLQRPDPEWEREFAQFSAEHELEVAGSAAQVSDYFKNVPKLSRLRKFERAVAISGAVVWLAVFVPALPLLLSLDLVPSGLTQAVLPKVNSEKGRGFVRRLMKVRNQTAGEAAAQHARRQPQV